MPFLLKVTYNIIFRTLRKSSSPPLQFSTLPHLYLAGRGGDPFVAASQGWISRELILAHPAGRCSNKRSLNAFGIAMGEGEREKWRGGFSYLSENLVCRWSSFKLQNLGEKKKVKGNEEFLSRA